MPYTQQVLAVLVRDRQRAIAVIRSDVSQIRLRRRVANAVYAAEILEADALYCATAGRRYQRHERRDPHQPARSAHQKILSQLKIRVSNPWRCFSDSTPSPV